MAAELRALSHLQGELGLTDIAAAGGERHGNDDDTEVHDHAAVGASDESAQSLTTSGQHQLSACRTTGEPTETEGDDRSEPTGAEHH